MSNELLHKLRKEVSTTIDDESLMREAADALESQAREIEEVRAELQIAWNTCGDAEKKRDELRAALGKIAAIENRYNCGDWDEIEEARAIAQEALTRCKEEA